MVQAYAREESMAREFDAINSAYRDANKRSIFYEAVLDAAIEMISTLCIASVLWWVGANRLGSSTHPVTFALVVTFTQYIRQFFEPISLLSTRFTVLQSSLSGAERIFQLLDEKDIEADEDAALVEGSGPQHRSGPHPRTMAARPARALVCAGRGGRQPAVVGCAHQHRSPPCRFGWCD